MYLQTDEFQAESGKVYRLKRSMLLTKGPITTLEALKNGIGLRGVTQEQFARVIHSLQIANLGQVCQVAAIVQGRLGILFVKRPPCNEVREILRKDLNLCIKPEEYERRYSLPIPKYYISQSSLLKLVELGLLTREQITQ